LDTAQLKGALDTGEELETVSAAASTTAIASLWCRTAARAGANEGNYSADVFIPIAEDSGFLPIGRW